MMKTQIKRSFCVLLALVLLVGALPLCTVKVNALTPTYSVSSAYAATSYYDKLCAVKLTGNQRDDIINVALSQVGYVEGSYTGDYGGANDGSYLNYVEYNYWFNKCISSSMPVGGSYAHWCATFVSWCAEQAGIPTSILNRSTAAGHSSSYFNIYFYAGGSTLNASSDNNYHFLGYNYTPKKGDLFYTRTWSHVGLVVDVNGDYVTTVEGNTNDGGSADGMGVYRRSRAISSLYFGVPNYVEKEVYTPGTPVITGLQSTYTPGSPVTVRWGTTEHTNYYDLTLERMVNGQFNVYTQQSNASSGYSTSLQEGAYRVAVTAYNTESDTQSQSAWAYFSVVGEAYQEEACAHHYSATVLQAPTCTGDGIYGLSCYNCGEYKTVTDQQLSQQWLTSVPSGMNGSDFESRTMYRYRDYTSGGWKTVGSYSLNYAESWPSGFDTTSALYAQYNNYGKKVDAYENGSHKLTVNSDSLVGYLYYHWCYDGYAYTVNAQSGSYNRFHAYYSTKTPDQADKADASDNSYRFDDSTACDDSCWYFCVPVYTQSYTVYQSSTGWSNWSEWSTTAVSGSSTREVQSAGLYRYTKSSTTGHRYEAVVTAPTCTAQGYTTYTCAECGDSYVGDYTGGGDHTFEIVVTPSTCEGSGFTTKLCTACGYSTKIAYSNPLGHNYVSGICTACGVADPSYVPGAVIPTLTLKSPTLEFKDMITVNAFYTAENTQDVVEMGMITYSSKVSTWSVATAEHIIPGATYVESSGRYYSCSQGIHAKYLGDTVYLAIYAKLSDGSYAYSKLAGYSAVQYATSQLKNSSDTKLKQLVVAMLNYGAEAQLYFGHNTSALANAPLTAEQKALPAAYNSGMVSAVPSAPADKQGIFANNQGFASKKPAISFEGAFCINYFFTPNYAPDSGITMYYWSAEDYNANSVLTTSNATGKIKLEGSGTGQYQGDIEGIAAKELSSAVYVACAYKSGGTVWTSGVLGYSIGAYCSSQASKGTAISNLAMATAVYGYHAKQYFG